MSGGVYKKYLHSRVPIPTTTLRRLQRRKYIKKVITAQTQLTMTNEQSSLYITESLNASSDSIQANSENFQEYVVSDIRCPEIAQFDVPNVRFEEPNAEPEELEPDLPEDHHELDYDREDRKTPGPTLCNCTGTTSDDAVLMCLALASRHSLPWVAIVDILKMINKLFGKCVVNSTKYTVMKNVNAEENVQYHVYCPECGKYLGNKDRVEYKELMTCSCGLQKSKIERASTFFLILGLEGQIKTLLNTNEEFRAGLNYRFERQKIDDEALEDIYDGAGYKIYFKPGQLLWEKYNMSFTFNTDGVPVGNASKQSMWPIYATINELPPKLRSKYMILVGLYVGDKDPNMNVFLYPFIEEINMLSEHGLVWTLNDEEITSKIIPLCSCVDSVARCKMLNMNQFNGYYGCTLCYHKGQYTRSGMRFPNINIGCAADRSHESIIQDASTALSNKDSQDKKKCRNEKGVKGPSPLHLLRYFDLVQGMVPDAMHSVFLGNIKHHTELLKKSVGKKYYIGQEDTISAIDARLLHIKPPKSITRTPRSLTVTSLWKASEWRSWCIFYSVVCLKGILRDKYVVHLGMLSMAIYILLQKSISLQNLQTAHMLLLRYVYLYEKYFGEEAMVYNIHLLTHIIKGVENWGPLWTHSTFAFESQNRAMLQKRKSCARIAQQVVSKYIAFKCLPTLFNKYNASERTIAFCEDMSGRHLKHSVTHEQCVLFGATNCNLSNEEITCLCEIGIDNTEIIDIMSYNKMLHDGKRYTTSSYSKFLKNDDSFVLFKSTHKGRIEHMCLLNTRNRKNIAIVFVKELVIRCTSSELKDNVANVEISHIQQVLGEEYLHTIEPNDIVGQCIVIQKDEENFIISIPYGCYGD